MGHRHLFGSSHMFESGPDQNWNHMHTEQPYANLARAGTAENGSFLYPTENVSVEGVHFASHWNLAPSSNGYASGHNVEPHYQSDGSGPSYDPFLHPSNAGAFYTVPENYMHHAASSSSDRQTFPGIDGDFVDLTMGNGRGPHKRKSPGVPSVCERGSSSRYYGAGSSSDLPRPSELWQWQEKPNIDSQPVPWDCVSMTPNYISNGLSIRSEGSMRNVRSRPALDLESNLARAHLSSTNPSHGSCSTIHHDCSSSMDHSLPRSSALTREWHHSRISPVHGRIQVPDLDGFNHEPNDSIVGSTATNASLEAGTFHPDLILGRNPIVSPSFHGPLNQSVRGVRSNYSQRSSPAFRASSSTMRVGHVGSSDEGMQLVAESYSSRHPRPLSAIAWRHSDRSGRSRMSNERYRSLSDEQSLHEHLSSEGFMIMDRTFYGSRSMHDQYRDMRLDIDNMTYEELLALGERIGNVTTGLSEDLMSKSLTETIYCSTDQMQEEENCVICLEEYKNKDDVGTLKSCGHDYHVTCIKKWLSMKSSCPICKSSVVADDNKE